MRHSLSKIFLSVSVAVCGLLFAQGALASGYTATRYPIVLAHGLAGFDSIAGVYDYWYGIPAALERSGAQVFVTQVAAAQYSEVRGEQLLQQVLHIIAVTGADKVNLMGHSHGSQSIRYVAAVRPDLVASVIAIGGPTKGSPVADAIAGNTSGLSAWLLQKIGDGFFTFMDLISGGGYDQSTEGALYSLTSEGAAAFNQKYPQGVPTTHCGNGQTVVNGILYLSWSGTGHFTNLFDISDAAMAATGLAFEGAANDGLVGRCSSHLGYVLKDDFNYNHLDEINLMSGLTSWFETDPREVYRWTAAILKASGL